MSTRERKYVDIRRPYRFLRPENEGLFHISQDEWNGPVYCLPASKAKGWRHSYSRTRLLREEVCRECAAPYEMGQRVARTFLIS